MTKVVTCLVHGEVVVIHIRVVTLELVQLDVDDPLLVALKKMEKINYKATPTSWTDYVIRSQHV